MSVELDFPFSLPFIQADPPQLSRMAITDPLKNETESYRRALAQWIARVEPRTDYVTDQHGNRIYSKEKTDAYVQPIMRSMGLHDRDYTVWRLSMVTPIHPLPRSELYFIPISVVSGQPLMIQGGRHSMMVPGWYTVTLASFELTPEFDCLFIGDTSKARLAI